MSVTLQPIFQAIGFSDAGQQTALIKLLHASGAFGAVPGVGVMLDDKQADALLHNLTFPNLTQATHYLHSITQGHMLRRPPGSERAECEEPEHFKQHRGALMEALQQTGMLSAIKPARIYYDHVLIPGAVEGEVKTRLDMLRNLWDQGVRFGAIHLLGSERTLRPEFEPSADTLGADRAKITTEMQMMETYYYAKSAVWPKELQDIRVFEVNSFNRPNGERANTQDTIVSWQQTHPKPGEVLVVSSQPFARYQDAAVKSILPPSFHIETVGAPALPDVKISVAMDTIARQIDVGFPKLLEKLQSRRRMPQTEIVMFDPANINVDAATYQFRSNGDANGVTAKGRYTTDRWDPILNGDPILVHEKLDGKIFVADGHHRVDLAKKLNAKGAGPGKIPAMVLREADGYTAKDVKIIAAYKNIAHGKNDPVEAARVFKEANSGQVNVDLLPHLQMDKGNLRMSYSMSKLSDAALDSVAKGEVPAEMAAKVAETLPGDTKQQETVMRIISQKLHQNYDVSQNSALPILPAAPEKPEKKSFLSFVDMLSQQQAKTPATGLAC